MIKLNGLCLTQWCYSLNHLLVLNTTELKWWCADGSKANRCHLYQSAQSFHKHSLYNTPLWRDTSIMVMFVKIKMVLQLSVWTSNSKFHQNSSWGLCCSGILHYIGWLPMFLGNLSVTYSRVKSCKLHSVHELKHGWTDRLTAKTHSVYTKSSQKAGLFQFLNFFSIINCSVLVCLN